MENLKLTGIKRISINDNPDNVIEFNPQDILFIERFYAVYREFQAKQVEFDVLSKELDDNKNVLAEDGLPVNFEAGLKFLKDTCIFVREKIDIVFGAGTSQKAFGDALSLEMIEQFFKGVTPFVWEARAEKVQKYSNTAEKKHSMK